MDTQRENLVKERCIPTAEEDELACNGWALGSGNRGLDESPSLARHLM